MKMKKVLTIILSAGLIASPILLNGCKDKLEQETCPA